MRGIINENAQLIKVGPGVVLTPSMIGQALLRARDSKLYAKFYTNKVFIQVNFARNGDISISSNIMNPAFLTDYRRRIKDGWSFVTAKAFVYQWMSLSRKSLY